MPDSPALQNLRLSGGTELAYRTAGDSRRGALILLHGLPNSSRNFRHVIEPLWRSAFVVAPDFPGFGDSEPLPNATFAGFADAIEELLSHLGVEQRVIYLHDFGAPVGLQLAMRAPHRVRGLIVQNANAHQSGMDAQWAATKEFWAAPTPENEAAATAHLSFEGTRDTYIRGAPPDVVARMDPRQWEEDWRVMRLPGRMETQRSLLVDYGRYVAQFDEIAAYLKAHRPPALMVWGRHDAFFHIAEVQSWLADLPRMEAHILDGAHLLLETHGAKAAALIGDFLESLPA
ncbi:alpha/beta fold hydrolase [Phenylobacterium terrae]|uniref:Alpha/beta fold hydrolase n=1 Tax=Phenylobacterium terrae TaxID=2665495 RepID=A0ABW4N735_9CAUL